MDNKLIEQIADAIDAARYAHPDYPRERPRPFSEADRSDREYATRLARAVLPFLSPARDEALVAALTDLHRFCNNRILGSGVNVPEDLLTREHLISLCEAAARALKGQPSPAQGVPELATVISVLRTHTCNARRDMTVGECFEAELCRCSCGLFIQAEKDSAPHTSAV